MARCAAGMAAATTMTTSTAAGECIGGNSNASDRQGGCQKRYAGQHGFFHFMSFPLNISSRDWSVSSIPSKWFSSPHAAILTLL